MENFTSSITIDSKGNIIAIGSIRQNYGDPQNILAVGPLLSNDKQAIISNAHSLLKNIQNLENYNELVFYTPSTNKKAEEIVNLLSNGECNNDKDHMLFPQFTNKIVNVSGYSSIISNNFAQLFR